MKVREIDLMVYPGFNGIFWAYYGLDIPEWTKPEYCHQN